MSTALQTEHVSKSYLIAHQRRERYVTLRDVLGARFRALENRGRGLLGGHRSRTPGETTEEFWALKDVSFEAGIGERIGIVGRNGAGKSTLLKVLSRITDPTIGRIAIRGRISSLLEVGTGFHPELTGKENIFLNGAILGMPRTEIQQKYDAIVAFSEIERFLDTPVKRYSSGMYVRLAFSVAAHLESEVLLVDEVLAVGDAEFQRRCIARMGDLSKQSGRTLLFVSHNLGVISNLCERVILLDGGKVQFDGPTDEGLRKYASRTREAGASAVSAESVAQSRPNWAKPLITGCRIINEACEPVDAVFMGDELAIEVTFASPEEPIRRPVIGVVVNSVTRGVVGGVNTRMTGPHPKGRFREGRVICRLGKPKLLNGDYTIDVWLGDGNENLDVLEGSLRLSIEPADVYRTGVLPFADMGSIYLQPTWEFSLDE